jgi:OOP family OmpA-OmpF porin
MIKSAKHSLLLATLLGLSVSAFAQNASGIDRGMSCPTPSTSAATSSRAVPACAGAPATGPRPWPSRNAASAGPGEEGCEPRRRGCRSRQGRRPAAAAPKPAAQKVTLAADALFDFNKADLRAEGKAKLDKLAADIKGIKLEVIIAVGHADRFGDRCLQPEALREARRSRQGLSGKQGCRAEPRLYRRQGQEAAVTKADQCKGPKSKKVVDCLQPDRRVDIEVIGTK